MHWGSGSGADDGTRAALADRGDNIPLCHIVGICRTGLGSRVMMVEGMPGNSGASGVAGHLWGYGSTDISHLLVGVCVMLGSTGLSRNIGLTAAAGQHRC